MSTTSTTPSETVPIGSLVLIALGVVPYAMVMAGMSDLHDIDGISRGLAAAYAVVGIVILWIMLAILLAMGAAKGRMPRWAGIAALILHPVSLVAVGATVDLLSSPGFDWAPIVPGVLPPVIAVYALWARLPGLHGIMPETPTSLIVWGAVLMLSIAPWVGIAQRSSERAAARAHHQPVAVLSEEERRAQATCDWQARLETLTPDSALHDYLEYIKPGSPGRGRAIAIGSSSIISRFTSPNGNGWQRRNATERGHHRSRDNRTRGSARTAARPDSRRAGAIAPILTRT